MATQTFSFSPNQILQPIQMPQDARMDAAGFGPSLTIRYGQALARKTSDNKLYPLNRAASDGTQTFVAFSAYSLKTDSASLVYYATGSNGAVNNPLTLPISTSAVYTKGTFDPNDLITAATSGTATAEVDTFTPATVTTGDINQITLPNGAVVSFTVGGTTTAAAVVTGLTAAWNANSYAVALGTPSGSATFIVTAATPGTPLNLSSAVAGTGTLTKVITTPSVAASRAEVDTITPAGSITTGDVNTLTATFPDLSTRAVSFTTGATTTATAVSAGLIAAWNADATLAALATASGTTTVVLTAVNTGQTLSIAPSIVGSGTLAKVVTTATYGRSLADILPGAPGARILHNGFWQIP